jgi:hypothetical protein
MTESEDLRDLWRAAPVGAPPSLDALLARTLRLTSGSSRRRWSETLAGGVGMVFMAALGLGQLGFAPTPLLQAGCAALVLGEAIVIATLWRRRTPRPMPVLTAPTEQHLAYLRNELIRERDLLSDTWRWYVAPLLPGLTMVPVALILAIGRYTPPAWTWMNLGIFVAATVGILAFIAARQRRTARRLGQEIQALDVGSSVAGPS